MRYLPILLFFLLGCKKLDRSKWPAKTPIECIEFYEKKIKSLDELIFLAIDERMEQDDIMKQFSDVVKDPNNKDIYASFLQTARKRDTTLGKMLEYRRILQDSVQFFSKIRM